MIKNNIKTILLFALIATITWSCASSGTLGGGPKDTQPPIIIESESTPNKLTFFTKRDIVLVFDEFIELKNAAKEIIVSPPLKYRIQTKVRGKKITLSFNEEEELKDSLTYIINFGNSIKDFRAGNPLENHRFIFSTGSYIDSLSIQGSVKDGITSKPVAGALVMLYDDLRDSVVINDRPFYFTRTDKEGNFKIENIKADTFRVYACKDDNGNYVYNQGTELIGFLTEDIYLDSSNINNLEIELTKPEADLRLLAYDNEFENQIDVFFNNELREVPTYKFTDSIMNWSKVIKDTVRIWYDTDLDSTTLIFPALDTLTIYKKDKKPEYSLTVKQPYNVREYRQGDTLYYESNVPILAINKIDSTFIKDTSDVQMEYEMFIEEDGFNIGFIPQLISGNNYNTFIWPGQMVDLYGKQNDTIRHLIKVLTEEDLSSVQISLKGMDSMSHYLVKVFSNTTTYYNEKLTGVDSLTLILGQIVPVEINVEVVTDKNQNGKWDAASIWGRKPAEKILTQKISKPKPNWSIEEEIDINTNQGANDNPLKELPKKGILDKKDK